MRLPGRRSPRPRGPGSFRAGFAATLALDVPARVLGAATLFVLVRALPVSAFAQYALLLALAGLASGAAGGGVRMRYIRLTAECDSRAMPDTARPAFSGALATTVALMAALSAVGLLAGRLAAEVGVGGSLVPPSSSPPAAMPRARPRRSSRSPTTRRSSGSHWPARSGWCARP